MAFDMNETSVDSAQPIELYIFSYNGISYFYTTSQYTQNIEYNGDNFVFNPEYIKRGDSLKLGDSGGSIETCTITVLRNNAVALLYQGSPPEIDEIHVEIYRIHGENNNDFIKILDGVVSQVRFLDSEAELTITIENVLNRYIPRGTLSYYCQNCIYDEKCGLVADSYALKCYVDGGIQGLNIYSSNLMERPSGYFTDGYLHMGNSFRSIVNHTGNCVVIKYPINMADRLGSFTVYPGCSNLFKTCAERFGNTDNFNGVPYIQPYDAFRHPVDRGAYWVDSEYIVRDTRCALYDPNL